MMQQMKRSKRRLYQISKKPRISWLFAYSTLCDEYRFDKICDKIALLKTNGY